MTTRGTEPRTIAPRMRWVRLMVGVAVAVAVAVPMSVSFGGSSDDRDGPRHEDPPPSLNPWVPADVLTVWPENPVTADVADPEVVQQAVDEGEGELRWRTDPEHVVRRFVAEVLGWNDPSVVEIDTAAGDADVPVRWYDVDPCSPDDACRPRSSALSVVVAQPARHGVGGIWSVIRASSEWLRIDVPEEAGPARLEAGGDLAFRSSAPRSTRVHIGVVASNGCESVSDLEPGLSAGKAALVVPAFPSGGGCGKVGGGYAFAYAQAAMVVPIGDPLLESAAIDFPYLTIVPVVVSPADIDAD